MMQLVYAAFLIATLSISTGAEAIIRCEMNGKPVNTNNGAETAGLTGLLRCREEDTGRLQREQEEFEAFLERLRASKDKSEFDQYLDERARAARDTNGHGDNDQGKADEGGRY